MKNMESIYKIAIILLLFCVCGPVFAKVITVVQKNKSFVKGTQKIRVIDIKKGDSIRFENADPFFHNVYSMSDLKMFDLGSYKSGKAKSVTFDKVGKVEVECAIHPRMILKVTVK